MFLAWLDPYVQPRRSSSNLIVIDKTSELDDADNEDEGTCTPVDSSSGRSITPDPGFEPKSLKSKVTGRPKYLHAKRPRVNNEAIEGAEIDFLKSIGNHLVSRDSQREQKDEECLFGELIAAQLRKMPTQERLTTKMEINNLIFSRLLKSNSQDVNTVSYVASRYPETTSRSFMSELGNVEAVSTYPPGYFFQQRRHEGL
jgi:hypothetical protein